MNWERYADNICLKDISQPCLIYIYRWTIFTNPRMCNGYYMRDSLRKHIYGEFRKRPYISTLWWKMPTIPPLYRWIIWNMDRIQTIIFHCHRNLEPMPPHHQIRLWNISHKCKLCRYNCICYIKDNCKLKTKVFSKPTDRQNFLHRRSKHPESLKKNFPYGQLLRGKRICTEQNDFQCYCSKLTDSFRKCVQRTIWPPISKEQMLYQEKLH